MSKRGDSNPESIRRAMTPATAQDHGGLRLTPHQLAHLRTRLQVQPPRPGEPFMETVADMTSRAMRLQGIPVDVLLTLEALHLLADQGNPVARELYQSERIRLGIDRPSFFYRRSDA